MALICACLVALACVVLATAVWEASEHALHPSPTSFAELLRRYRTLAWQGISFQSATRTTIVGRFFPGRSRATIILSHGYGADQDQMLPWANFLHRAGFSVFTYDMRGCGRSGGSITFGALEQRDLISAVNYLASRDDVNKAKIGALGFSLGGATTILAAAQDTQIKAVVDDSGYADVRHWFNSSLGEALRHPTDPFSALSLQLLEWRAGIDADKLRPDSRIALISPRPI